MTDAIFRADSHWEQVLCVQPLRSAYEGVNSEPSDGISSTTAGGTAWITGTIGRPPSRKTETKEEHGTTS